MFAVVPFQGVFISKIAEGGTAERDGRLQVGDKVLSVRKLANVLCSNSASICDHFQGLK